MNKISIKTYFNTFSKQKYYGILIDNTSLEDFVLKNNSDRVKHGLVSTFLNWLSDPNERRVVWERTLPELDYKTNLPILMCGEDIDLWCDVIITEIEISNEYVYWNKFGLDIGSGENMPESIGKNVEWFDNIKPLKFEKEEYTQVITLFKKYLNDDFIGEPYEN